jgi:hypothetical protein
MSMEGGFKGEEIYNKRIDAVIKKLKKKNQILREHLHAAHVIIEDMPFNDYWKCKIKKVLKETEGD